MTAKEFLDLSTRLFGDMKAWIAEAAKDDTLSASDLAMLSASMKIVERVTLKEVEIKPGTSKLDRVVSRVFHATTTRNHFIR